MFLPVADLTLMVKEAMADLQVVQGSLQPIQKVATIPATMRKLPSDRWTANFPHDATGYIVGYVAGFGKRARDSSNDIWENSS
jgi:hypothetical protein